MHCTWFSLLNYELVVFIVTMCVRSNAFVCSGFIHSTLKLQLFVYCWQSLALSCSAISFTSMCAAQLFIIFSSVCVCVSNGFYRDFAYFMRHHRLTEIFTFLFIRFLCKCVCLLVPYFRHFAISIFIFSIHSR